MKRVLLAVVTAFSLLALPVYAVEDNVKFNDHCLEQVSMDVEGAFDACVALGYDANDAFVVSARHKNNLDILRVLLGHGVDVNVFGMFGYHTALMSAANFGHVETVDFLLNQENINVNITGPSGVSALMIAVVYNHVDVVRLLLEVPEIDVNLLSATGATALSLADFFDNEEMMALLREAGAVH